MVYLHLVFPLFQVVCSMWSSRSCSLLPAPVRFMEMPWRNAEFTLRFVFMFLWKPLAKKFPPLVLWNETLTLRLFLTTATFLFAGSYVKPIFFFTSGHYADTMSSISSHLQTRTSVEPGFCIFILEIKRNLEVQSLYIFLIHPGTLLH